MNKEREASMFLAAKILNGPFNKIDEKDFETILEHGNLPGAFICGVRWADNNPESPWNNINNLNPENCVPKLHIQGRERKYIKVLLRFKDGSIMESHRVRLVTDNSWIWGIPIRMQDQITHWMCIPPIPEEIKNKNKKYEENKF